MQASNEVWQQTRYHFSFTYAPVRFHSTPPLAICAYSASLLDCIVSHGKSNITSTLSANRALRQSGIAHPVQSPHSPPSNPCHSLYPVILLHRPPRSILIVALLLAPIGICSPDPSFVIVCFDYAKYPSPFMVG